MNLSQKQVVYLIEKYLLNKCEESFMEICSNFNGIRRYVINKYDISYLPYESVDIDNELKLLLVTSIREYKVKLNVDFSLFYYARCINHVCKLFRKYNAQKRKVNNLTYFEEFAKGSLSYSDVIQDPKNDIDKYYKKVSFESKLNIFKSCLTKDEMSLYLLYLNGLSYKEISAEISMPLDKIKGKLTYIRKKIKNKHKILSLDDEKVL